MRKDEVDKRLRLLELGVVDAQHLQIGLELLLIRYDSLNAPRDPTNSKREKGRSNSRGREEYTTMATVKIWR